jgi:hypothetical protein
MSSSSSSIAFEELVGSRTVSSGTNPKIELKYRLAGTSSEATALSVAEASVPATYGSAPVLVLQTVKCEPVFVDTVDDRGEWLVTATYGELEPQEVGGASYNFDTGGGTAHITHSKSTEHSYLAGGGNAPDHKQAIGWTPDGIEGVDITVPVFNFSETHIIDDADVDNAYKLALHDATGKTNAGTFKGFAVGTVLFLGASGSKRGNDSWEITFNFAASPNETALVVGDITGIAKDGWEYLWIRFEDEVDAGPPKTRVKRPLAAYTEKVYDSADFATLGIGVT